MPKSKESYKTKRNSLNVDVSATLKGISSADHSDASSSDVSSKTGDPKKTQSRKGGNFKDLGKRKDVAKKIDGKVDDGNEFGSFL